MEVPKNQMNIEPHISPRLSQSFNHTTLLSYNLFDHMKMKIKKNLKTLYRRDSSTSLNIHMYFPHTTTNIVGKEKARKHTNNESQYFPLTLPHWTGME